MKKEVKLSLAAALGFVLTAFTINEISNSKIVESAFLNKAEQQIQQKVDRCNAIQTVLLNELNQKGPPVVCELLGTASTRDESSLIRLIQERSIGASSARQQALAVLQMPWYTPDPVLRKRVQLIDNTLIAMRSFNSTISPHSRDCIDTIFQWYPHN